MLAVNNIEVLYDRVILVLKGVSLTVPRGGIVALLGANGAGKTTTLKAISNLLRAERGEVVASVVAPRMSPRPLVGRVCWRELSIQGICPAPPAPAPLQTGRTG
jgi:branched-chain amino acid transport system ATP-binding protein